MPSPHMDVYIVRRANDDSALAAAAYGAGVRLYDHRLRDFHDWRHRKDVAHAEIMGPEGMADYLYDRETLWNKVEELETRKDAQLARRVILALPCELGPEERLELVREYVAEQFVSKGMVADIALHNPDLAKGKDHRNFHAHILLTLRKAGPDGLYRTKTREWNSRALIPEWRAAWADHQTRALQRAGHQVVLNRKTLKPETQLQHPLPRNLQLETLPEFKLGREFKPDSPQWNTLDERLARNITRAAAVRRRVERKKQRFLELKEDLYRRKAFLMGSPGAEFIQNERAYPDKRSLLHVEGRLWLLMSIEDKLFYWDVFCRGFEAAVRLQRKRFKRKWEKDRAKERTRERSRERFKF
ncbi:MAG: MobQ family relaxase [Filomicrobium sp.]